MSGKPKQKVYEYTQTGKFVRTYDSQAEAREVNFSNVKGKKPVFQYKEHRLLDNGNVLVKERIGRDAIKSLLRRESNEFLKDYKSPKVKLLNLDNKVIATFKNTNIASKLTGIPESTIANQISSKYDNVGWTDRGLLFRSND